MATVKVKFRPSATEGHEGTLYYRIIHDRIARQVSTGHRLFPEEWDKASAAPVSILPGREAHIHEVHSCIEADLASLHRIITGLERRGLPYSADDVVGAFRSRSEAGDSFFAFMRSVIVQMQRAGRIRIAETYSCTLNSFTRFRGGTDLSAASIDADLMLGYEAYLRDEGLCRNSTSFYMRNLRSVYNRAVDKGLTAQHHPFRLVYTGVDKTVKRAVPVSVIKSLKAMNLTGIPALELARDMFLFSFYTRGMSFIDMSYLRKSDLVDGMLTYRRKKTGQKLTIRWEKCMEEIAGRYHTESSPYLLPVIKPGGGNERTQYRNMSHTVNRSLKTISGMLGLETPLTMYVARHSWASVAKSRNIPLSVISGAMGHDSEATTRIYISSLDTGEIDKANRMILDSL